MGKGESMPLGDITNVAKTVQNDNHVDDDLAAKRQKEAEKKRASCVRKKAEAENSNPKPTDEALLDKKHAQGRERQKAAKELQNEKGFGDDITLKDANDAFLTPKAPSGLITGFQRRLTNAPNQARQFGRDRLKDMNVL